MMKVKFLKVMTSTNEGEFKVGDKVTITAGHMPGMKGAEAVKVRIKHMPML